MNGKNQVGQAVVELALMLPLLILILVGILDLGRIFDAQLTITNAAREGARYAIDHSHTTDLAAIQNRAASEAAAGGIAPVTTSVVGLGSGSGNPVTVTVTHDFHMLTTSIFANVSTIGIGASAVMQIK